MQSNPNREKMSPAQITREQMQRQVRTYCPCCGGSLGIRAAFRYLPWIKYNKPIHRLTGRKPRGYKD